MPAQNISDDPDFSMATPRSIARSAGSTVPPSGLRCVRWSRILLADVLSIISNPRLRNPR